MSNLLQIVRSKADVTKVKKGMTPLILEFHVDAQTAPYLVSSSTGVLWIDRPFPGDHPFIKAAVRKGVTPGTTFWNAARAIFEKSKECQWGSAQPFTESGLAAAIEHVMSYDLGPVDVLVNSTGGAEKLPRWILDREIGENLRYTEWVPENCVIVIPSDRSLLGMLVHLSSLTTAMAIHNAARGFAMCWTPPPTDVEQGVEATIHNLDPNHKKKRKSSRLPGGGYQPSGQPTGLPKIPVNGGSVIKPPEK